VSPALVQTPAALEGHKATLPDAVKFKRIAYTLISDLPQSRKAVVKPVLLKLEKEAPDCKSIFGMLMVTISEQFEIETIKNNSIVFI